LTNEKFPKNVTINDENGNILLQFQCLSAMTIGRIRQIVCQMSEFDEKFYVIKSVDDDFNIDDELSLEDVFESTDQIQLKLIISADVKCLIAYQDKTIQIPANNETLLQSILEKAVEKIKNFIK
jgi:hypothetical protein